MRDAGLAGRYVGAHPMAGNELSGWAAADPALYDNALWAMTVDGDTDYRRFLAVARMITDDAGNRVIVLDDDTHDRAAALISHMPHVVATALINQLTDDPDRNIAAALAAGSWRDMTRVALTDPDRTRAMVEEDADNVERLLRMMAARLTEVADELHGADAGAIAAFFADGQPFRDYKSAVRSGADGDGPVFDLTIPAEGWQAALLDSPAAASISCVSATTIPPACSVAARCDAAGLLDDKPPLVGQRLARGLDGDHSSGAGEVAFGDGFEGDDGVGVDGHAMFGA